MLPTEVKSQKRKIESATVFHFALRKKVGRLVCPFSHRLVGTRSI